jgi:hypothetical protein
MVAVAIEVSWRGVIQAVDERDREAEVELYVAVVRTTWDVADAVQFPYTASSNVSRKSAKYSSK